jgi:hypothetical protein
MFEKKAAQRMVYGFFEHGFGCSPDGAADVRRSNVVIF